MLSILIPIHNYNVVTLVKELLQQAKGIDGTIEIICCDDCSTDTQLKTENINYLASQQIKLLENKTNIGRTKTRQLLANNATYNWILFLDVDVIPVLNSFLSTYISYINIKHDCIYGGLKYQEEQPGKEHLLRWVYGHQREDIALQKRKTTPYKSIASGNILIKKKLFLKINQNLTQNWYGFDNFFSAQLKELNSTIIHINNKVYQIGLEDNIDFLHKQELATYTVFKLYQNNDFSNNHDNGLLKTFLKLKKFKLVHLYTLFYKCIKSTLKRNLLGSSPKLYYLDLYRLGYFCALNTHKDA